MAEGTPAAPGPRYAPVDPTLPKPWKGLIDGNSGMLYYWNVDTNVTQYEKPAGPPASVSVPNMASIPGVHSVQHSDVPAPHGKQMMQASQQQGQQTCHSSNQQEQAVTQQQSALFGQVTHQHASQIAQAGQLQNFQPAQSTQQKVLNLQTGQHQGPQMPPQVGHQISQQPNQQMPHQLSQNIQQSSHQMHQHAPPQQVLHRMPSQAFQMQQYGQGTQHGMHMGQPQSYHFSHQTMQHMPYQQSAQQVQLNAQGQPSGNQPEYKSAFPKMEEVEFHNGKRVGFSPNKYQHNSISSVNDNQNVTSGVNSSMMPHMNTQSGQAQQFSGSSGFTQQSPPSIQEQQCGSDSFHQQDPRYQNQMGPSLMLGQLPKVSSVGVMGHEDNINDRGGSEYFYNSKKEGPSMDPQQPNVTAVAISRNHQEMRMTGAPFPNAVPGLFNGGPGHPMHNMFNHPSGGPSPFPNNSVVRPPLMGLSSVNDLSPTEIYCQQHEVTATGGNVPAPFLTFEATGFPSEILREIYSAGFTNPTPIQAQTWPVALQNRDIVAIAKTGSGKTLGYLIPAFMLLRQRRNNPQYGPTVLVLSPTRELATQIRDEAVKFGRSSRISITCLYGGAPKGPQLKELERGADIVVATPGRLNDILESKKIDFRQVSLIVLDEADRMLDMGFEPQIRRIVNEIPPRRQTLMFTATWPKEVRKIASDLLMNPVQVNIGNVDELVANKAITQYVEVVPQIEKQRRLEQILRSQNHGSKVIIFCSTKKLCDQLARSIGRSFGSAAIHGDKSQGERDWVLNQFRSGKSPILVATDVAARGLDIKDIRVVINYDFPTGVEDYVHRIGRTGRAGAVGVSYTFFSEQDWKHAADLIKVLEGANQLVPPEIREMAMRGPPNFGKDRMSRFDSGGGSGPGRWDSGGRGGMRNGGFSGRGGMRDGGCGGLRDGGFGDRFGMRDGGYGGRGGHSFSGRGNKGHGLAGPGGGHVGGGRNERGSYDRYIMDGQGRGRGRGRFDNRRDIAQRSRSRSYSRSPERVRTWGYSRSSSSSSSRSSSRGRSRRRSSSRGRNCRRSSFRGRSCSGSRGYSHSVSRSRSGSRSRDGLSYRRSDDRGRIYDMNNRSDGLSVDGKDTAFLETESPERVMPPVSPVAQGNIILGIQNQDQSPAAAEFSGPECSDTGADLAHQSVTGNKS